jgi:hypothetical protein
MERDAQLNQLSKLLERNQGYQAGIRQTVEGLLDRNLGDFQKTLDTILDYTHAVDTQVEKALTLPHGESNTTLQNMFSTELTQSVITAVYLQNAGNLAHTVDMLWEISKDEDAIEKIRTMDKTQCLKLTQDMKSDQEKRVEQRKKLLKAEIEKAVKDEIEMREKLTLMAKDSKIPQYNYKEQTNLIQIKQKEILQKELLFSKIEEQAARCVLSCRYGVKTVIISWAIADDMKPNSNDWIGFYKVGRPLNKYRQYIRTCGSRQDYCHFPTPKTPGLYLFKYFVNGSYQCITESDILHIGVNLTIKSTFIESNQKLKVDYQLLSGTLSPNDWFGLYNINEPNNRSYISYQFTGYREPPQTSYTLYFDAPRTPGTYIVKYFPSLCGYTDIYRSQPIVIPKRDFLFVESKFSDEVPNRIKGYIIRWDIFSIDCSLSDYIGLYEIEAPNNSYIEYKYIDLVSGYIFFTAPTKLGKYQFRYHSVSLSKYQDVVSSDPVEIRDTDIIEVTLEGKKHCKGILGYFITTEEFLGLDRHFPMRSY